MQKFPSLWKLANVTPVFKKGDNKYCSNYRPISLLSNLSKVFEKLVHKHIYEYLTGNNLLIANNSGFKHGDCAINQLVKLSDTILKSLDQGKEVRMVFLDAAKAFDKVWHAGLLFKLKQLGIEGSILYWIESYLSDRSQSVVINGSKSEILPLQAGVPQGSVLGPLLFLVYVNDINRDITSNISLFADDTSLFDIVHNPKLTAQKLNEDLAKLQVWAAKWQVTFNPSKTVIS